MFHLKHSVRIRRAWVTVRCYRDSLRDVNISHLLRRDILNFDFQLSVLMDGKVRKHGSMLINKLSLLTS